MDSLERESVERKRKLTLMLIPHSGRQVKSIQLSSTFFIGIVSFAFLVLGAAMFFGIKYIASRTEVQKSIAYIEEREEALSKIESDLKKTSEVATRLTDELKETRSILNGDNDESGYDLVRDGDFSRALDIAVSDYDDFAKNTTVLNLSQRIEEDLPVLESVNELVKSQQKLFKDLPIFWPVRGSLVSMEWGPNIHPIYGSWYIHKGMDFAAAPGTPVQAAADGEVTYVGYDSGYGLHIYVAHKYGFKSHYSHLSSIKVKKGQRVSQGDIIGGVGSTGLVTGPHLDLQLYLGNELLDPGVYLRIFNQYHRPSGNR